MRALLRTIVCKFGGDPAICLREEAIFVKSQKCLYHMTFDVDLDLEHIMDAGLSGDHRVQVWWRSNHLPARRSDLRKMFTWTDGRTDGRRTPQRPHNCISSRNELIMLAAYHKIIPLTMLICQQILAIVITKYHSVHISTQCNQDNTSTFGFRLTNLLFLFTPGSDKSHWIVAVQIFTGGQISFLSESSH